MPYTDERFGRLQPCPKCGGNQRAEWLRQFSRIDGEMAALTMDDWVIRPGLEQVTDRVRKFVKVNTWLTLSGPPGTGKTMWLAMLANYYIEAGKPVVYTTMAELLDDLRATYDKRTKRSYSQLFADIKEADYLCLDEIEKVNSTGWAMEKVFMLLEYRHRARGRLATMLATQVDLRQRRTEIYPTSAYPGYLESRIHDSLNVLITDFWAVTDFRTVQIVDDNGTEAMQLPGFDGA